jgi:hypothetical protein
MPIASTLNKWLAVASISEDDSVMLLRNTEITVHFKYSQLHHDSEHETIAEPSGNADLCN